MTMLFGYTTKLLQDLLFLHIIKDYLANDDIYTIYIYICRTYTAHTLNKIFPFFNDRINNKHPHPSPLKKYNETTHFSP